LLCLALQIFLLQPLLDNKLKFTVKMKNVGRLCRFVTGAVYDGEWLDNRKHGQGTYYYTDSSRYEGAMSNFTAMFVCSFEQLY